MTSLENTIHQYVALVEDDCRVRFEAFPLDLFEPVVYEVVCGLLARQGTLARELALNPNSWTPHFAPLVQRAMSDAHITLAYILHSEHVKRAHDYVLYALGQEKLSIAHIEVEIEHDSSDDNLRRMLDAKKTWLNSQRYEHLTTVNVGSHTGLSTRQMAEQCDLLGLYDYNFTPFSGCVHSTWQHVERFNLERCWNPLHGGHKVPILPIIPPDWHELVVVSRSLHLSLAAVDTFCGAKQPIKSWIFLLRELRTSPDAAT